MNVEFQGHNADLDNVRGQNRTLAAANLIIPTTFEEALSYAEQIWFTEGCPDKPHRVVRR